MFEVVFWVAGKEGNERTYADLIAVVNSIFD